MSISGGPAGYETYSKGKRTSTASVSSFARAQRDAHDSPGRPALPAQWASPASPSPSPSSPSPSVAPSTPPPASPPATPKRVASPATQRTRTPYHATFQPQGVRRDRTELFAAARRTHSERKKLDEGRLCRRMDKLLALHFPLPVVQPHTPARASPLAQISDLGGSLRAKSARDLWRSVARGKSDAELAEQTIVKWQDDAEATKCPICSVSFGLKTRRHHCRLCGRVVCFLPPTPPSDLFAPPSPSAAPAKPTRRERCSTFFTYQYEGMLVGGEKKPVGVVVEIEQVEPDLSLGGVVADVHAPPKDKDERDKVRICRECLNTVLRNQDATLPPRTPTWVKLYEVLVQLESEISTLLPEFQELVLGLQKPSTISSAPSAHAALSLRKRLLTNLASYDTIAKRVRELPLADGGAPGGSQDRLQRAIAARALLFLGEKLALLRSLGDIEEQSGKGKKKGRSKSVEPTVQSLASLMNGSGKGAAPEIASGLAVLLEQEALVLGYVEDANARRQFEDAASLKASLNDLREEIARVRAAA